jgi:hypothetical protein
MHPCFVRSNRELCILVPREKKRPSKAKQQQAKAKEPSNRLKQQLALPNPTVQEGRSTVASGEADGARSAHTPYQASSQPQSNSQSLSKENMPSSTWMQNHDQWLMKYVQFLVFGETTGSSTPQIETTNGYDGAFLPPSKNPRNISVDDVCDEIVNTFGKQDEE